MLEGVQLTRQGIPKLASLQGKFCKSDIIIQLLLEDSEDTDELEPTEEYNATASDATSCFPALVLAQEYEIYRGVNLFRVKEVLCCFSPTGYPFVQ